jgi:hypothetical protein
MASVMTLINEALTDKSVVEAIRSIPPALDSFSFRAGSDMEFIEGNSVYVPLATDPTVQNKIAGTTPAASGTLTGVPVTLNVHKSAPWDAIEGKIGASMFASWWAAQAAGAVRGCVLAAVNSALTLIVKSTYGDVENTDKITQAPANFKQAELGLLIAAAARKIKGTGKSFGMNPAYWGALLGNPSLGMQLALSGLSPLQTGIIPSFAGLGKAWMLPEFPSNSQNLGGAVFGKAAIAIAAGVPSQLMGPGDGNIMDSRVITDPDSGISVLYRVKAEGGGTVTGEVSMIYGFAAGQNSIVRLVEE